MKVRLYSHRYAYEILNFDGFKHVFNEIITICRDCPIPVYENKSKSNPNLKYVQPTINSYFETAFQLKNWESQPLVSSNQNSDMLKADFIKKYPRNKDCIQLENSEENMSILIEVEFGNAASYYRDLYKFLLAHSLNIADICVLIVPCKEIEKYTDSGLVNFEKAIRELPESKLNIPIPLLVIGLDYEEKDIWDLRGIINNYSIASGTSKEEVYIRNILLESYIDSKNNPSLDTLKVFHQYLNEYLEKIKANYEEKHSQLNDMVIENSKNNSKHLSRKIINLQNELIKLEKKISDIENELSVNASDDGSSNSDK